ncbi:MAG: LD-carboxypeptidase [Gracilimonas sp.]|uniref:S66 peptidase family protein n=1 Tax=Gracilimonas TaxID=649462 RepID=UPI001B00D5C8|nr:LD-carboxypeptidase [Gracilimonas sp.]MBO6586395.1 LD-carboxypeptidase [Gracilimonas sp.]MBO6615052.1 LD-carboxypeptidase [Gracilimonas sp.]
MAFTRKDFLKATALASFTGAAIGLAGCETKAAPGSTQKIKPKALKAGDTLGLVAPASPIYESSVFDEMLTNLQDLGFKLKLGEHVRNQRGYLAGTDQQRADDLMNMFRDPQVDGVMCIRGGWGCNRILPLLDYDVFKNNPKAFCGFSDITSLHMAMYQKSDLITFHGPVGKSNWNPFTTNAFKKIIFDGETPTFEIPANDKRNFVITPGTIEGKLLGGNLSVLVSMIGSDYLPSFEHAILYLEDVGESVYRIDRMLTQLKLAGILDQISGFVFGKCTDCDAGDNSLTLQQVFDDHIKPLDIPAFYGAMISHEDDNITLPVGLNAGIDATKKTIHVSEPAVV